MGLRGKPQAFDPDKFLKETEPSAATDFDPDAFLAETTPEDEKPGALENAAKTFMAFGAGAKRNVPIVGDYINNAAAAVMSGFNTSGPEYIKERDELNRSDEALKKEHPIAYGTGAVTGFLSPSALLKGAGLIGKGAKLANMSNKARVGTAVGAGAASGLLSDPGDVEGKVDPVQLKDRAINSAIGGGLGLATQLGTEAVSKVAAPVLKKAADKLESAADKWAFSSLRGYKKDIKKAFKKDEIEDIGRELHDQKLLGGVPKSIDKLAESARAKEKEIGAQYGGLLTKIDEAAGPSIDRKMVGNKVREQLRIKDESLGTFAKEFNDEIENFVVKFENNQKPMTLTQAKQFREMLKPFAKWDANFQNGVPPEVQSARGLYHALNEAADETAESLSGKVGLAPDLVPTLRGQINRLKTAATIAEGRSLGEVANRFVSPSDYGMGAAGAMISGGQDILDKGLVGAATGLLNKGAREYGGQITSRASRGLSRNARSLGEIANNPRLGASQQVLLQGLIKSGAIKPGDFADQEGLLEEPGLLRRKTSSEKSK